MIKMIMKVIKLNSLLFILFFAISCESKSSSKEVAVTSDAQPDLSQYKTAYFASGCFWCVEAVFESVKGVKEAVSGYSWGSEKYPTYKQVSYGKTSHAE